MKKRNDYNWLTYNNGSRVMVFNGVTPVTNYSKLPPRFIQIIADYFGLSLYGEMSMYTGKQVFKVGIRINDNGGIIGLYSTESRAKFNRFICGYIKKTL